MTHTASLMKCMIHIANNGSYCGMKCQNNAFMRVIMYNNALLHYYPEFFRKKEKQRMTTLEEYVDCWKMVYEIYADTVAKDDPELTVREIVAKFGGEKTKEIFAVVTAEKKWDRKISAANRAVMNSIPTDPQGVELENIFKALRNSRMLTEIYSEHINDMLTVLVSEMKKAGEV